MSTYTPGFFDGIVKHFFFTGAGRSGILKISMAGGAFLPLTVQYNLLSPSPPLVIIINEISNFISFETKNNFYGKVEILTRFYTCATTRTSIILLWNCHRTPEKERKYSIFETHIHTYVSNIRKLVLII